MVAKNEMHGFKFQLHHSLNDLGNNIYENVYNDISTQYLPQSLSKSFPTAIYSCLPSIEIKYKNNLKDMLLNTYVNFHDIPLRFNLDIYTENRVD